MSFLDRWYRVIGRVFLVFYLAYVFASFGWECLDAPVIQDDYVFHYTGSMDSALFLKSRQRMWAYNPYHNAGFPGEIFLSGSSYWSALFELLLGNFLNPPLIFNLSILCVYLALPLLAVCTAKNFGFSGTGRLLFFVLSISLVTTRNFVETGIGDFMSYGMYAFVLAVFLCLYVSSLFFRYVSEKKWTTLLKITFLGIAGFFIHPLFPIMCLVLCVPMLLFYLKHLHREHFFYLGLCSLFIMACSLWWIEPLVRFNYLRTSSSQYLQTSYFFLILSLIDGKFTLLMALCLFSAHRLIRMKGSYIFAATISSSSLLFFIMSFFGSQIGLADIQPARFVIPLALLSALLISKLAESEIRRNTVFFSCIIVLVCISINPPARFTCGYGGYEEASDILDFIKFNTIVSPILI